MNRFSLETEAKDAIIHLKERGYCIFENVLNEEEVFLAKQMVWDFLEGLGTGIKRDDTSTWENENWPGNFLTGIISHYGVGQCEAQWFIRRNKNVQRAFSHVWNTTDLVTSFDGLGIYRPWNLNEKWKTIGGWYHTDQGKDLAGKFCCVQGFVSLYDGNISTGGLVVIPQSHLRHEAVVRGSDYTGNFVQIEDGTPLEGLDILLVNYQPGDLVLWDSRTIHCNMPAITTPTVENDLLRAVQYICMMPKEWRSQQAYEHKIKAPEQGITTSHWANVYIPNRSPYARKGKESTKVYTHTLTEEEKELC